MRGHVVLSLKQLAGNSCKVSENVLCPAVIVSPVYVCRGGFMLREIPSKNLLGKPKVWCSNIKHTECIIS